MELQGGANMTTEAGRTAGFTSLSWRANVQDGAGEGSQPARTRPTVCPCAAIGRHSRS